VIAASHRIGNAFHRLQENRAIAKKWRDAAAIRCGLKFADIDYKFKSSQAPKEGFRHIDRSSSGSVFPVTTNSLFYVFSSIYIANARDKRPMKDSVQL